MLVILAGLPGTGKTTLAQELARKTGGAILNKDQIRAALFSESDISFSTQQDDFVMALMLKAAEYLLSKNPNRVVILDGRTFSRGYQLDQVISFAASVNTPSRILECCCTEESARKRIERSQIEGTHPAGNRDFELYKAVKSRFEPIIYPKTLINTDDSLENAIEEALRALSVTK